MFRRHVAGSQLPFGARDTVVKQGRTRYRGLEVTVVAPKRGPRFRAYVHTRDWERVLVVSTAASAESAMARAEALLTQAVGEGVEIHLPTDGWPLRLEYLRASAGG
jgi:hypothetical protein